MGPRDLLDKLHGTPFQPFRIRLTDDTTLDVTDPGTVSVGPTAAILPVRTSRDDLGHTLVVQWRTVAIAYIVGFADLNPPKPPARRRGK